MSRGTKKPQENCVVPELDKGNYNNKRNLLYFMEQEKLAIKMIEEARAFYNNFLTSKTTRFGDILKYPNIFFVKPAIYAFYRKAYRKTDKYGTSNGYKIGPKDKIAITVGFKIDFGEAENFSSFDSCYRNLIDTYAYTKKWEYEYEKPPTWTFENFNDKDTYLRYEAFLNKLANYDDCNCAEAGASKHYLCDITVQDLIDAGIHNPKDSERISDYDNNTTNNFFAEKHLKTLSRYDRGVALSKCAGSSRFTDYPENWEDIGSHFYFRSQIDAPELLKIDKIREYAEPLAKQYNEELKELLGQMLSNLKKENGKNGKLRENHISINLKNCEFLFKRNGDIIELLTPEIDNTNFDDKHGLYTINCKKLTSERAKHQWPTNGPVIRTESYQQFVFDVGTNDLIDYKFNSDSREIQYR